MCIKAHVVPPTRTAAVAGQAAAVAYQLYCARHFGALPAARSKARLALQVGAGQFNGMRRGPTAALGPAVGSVALREDALLAAVADAMYTDGGGCADQLRALGVEPLALGEQGDGKNPLHLLLVRLIRTFVLAKLATCERWYC